MGKMFLNLYFSGQSCTNIMFVLCFFSPIFPILEDFYCKLEGETKSLLFPSHSFTSELNCEPYNGNCHPSPPLYLDLDKTWILLVFSNIRLILEKTSHYKTTSCK
ncbi:hypothetical protein RND81_05G049800 [Saponaria officinalis]|uniref:Uncharacterized protein n=1 Tax=Saponaria officinalis TaxID=3572 RepID=A0AAW1KXL1_SAPOF